MSSPSGGYWVAARTDAPPAYVLASGGNGRLLVHWATQSGDGVSTADETAHEWTVDVRSRVDGAWTGWKTAATLDGDARHATVTGLPNTEHEVRVHVSSAKACDHDDDSDTPDRADAEACGTRGGYYYHTPVTTASHKTTRPGPVTNAKLTTASEGSNTIRLVVSWDDPEYGGEDVYGYKIRHWATGENAWEEHEFRTRRMWRSCRGSDGSCTNPRTHRIRGLATNAEYAVQVAALNVNGTGEWTTLASSASAPPVQAFVSGRDGGP